MNNNEITTVIFDLDFTLWSHNYENRSSQIAERVGIPYSYNIEEQIERFFSQSKKTLKNKIITEELLQDELQKFVWYPFNYNVDKIDFFNALVDIDTIVENPDVKALLSYLSQKGYKIVALSNWFYRLQIKVMKNLGLFEYFDEIYCWDNSYAKPDIRSIKRVINNKVKNQFVLIGDSLEHDIACANKAGIKSVWYNPQNKPNKKFKTQFEVGNLLDIVDILKL